MSEVTMKVIKRSGKEVEYDGSKVVDAINRAMEEVSIQKGIEMDYGISIATEENVNNKITECEVMTVEEIGDFVQKDLLARGFVDEGIAYITYRTKREKIRDTSNPVEYKYLSKEFLSNYKHLKNPFPNQLGEFVYYRTYSRYVQELRRREHWRETVARAVNYNIGLIKHKSDSEATREAEELYDNIFNLRQFLSGRTLYTGGTEASKLYGMSNYNCSFTIIDDFTSYKDMFYLLMIGSGVGYRVLKKDVAKLPKIRTDINVIHNMYEAKPKNKRQEYTSLLFTGTTAEIFIGDSKESWCDALQKFLELHYNKQYKKIEGIVIHYDDIRPKGERLKTFGGYSSGYESMLAMLKKIDFVIKTGSDVYKQLTPIECSDIANIIGENVVSGGVRRTSEVCLFDVDDKDIRTCKTELYKQNEKGEWVIDKDLTHRSMSNNSIQYWEKPSKKEWHKHIEEMRFSGEPAFQNMVATLLRRPDAQGANPCLEILLRKNGVCNLTEVNVMAFVIDGEIDKDSLFKAQRMSARAGYRMASIDFELHNWDLINKEDMLLGCSLTGWEDMINATGMSIEDESQLMRNLKQIAIEEGSKLADELGTNKPKLVTSIKPSGTLSQLPTVSNGCHWSHSPYYIRRVRISAQDPLAEVAKELGWKCTPENGQTWENMDTMVIEFYIKSPEGKTKYDISAIEQLEKYKLFMDNYTEHNTSITVHVREHEWELVEEWCYENWDSLVAVSFLSLDDSFYQQLPYEAITEEQYKELSSNQKKFNPELLLKYETGEESEVESSCESGVCASR